MKTFSFLYSYSSDFKENVNVIHIKCDQEVLVQVFTGIFDMLFITDLVAEIKECLPKAKIIGTTAQIGIFEAEYIKDSCIITVSIFENTNIQTYGIPKDFNDSYENGKQFANGICKYKAKAIIVFATAFKVDGQDLLNGITYYDKSVIISGGFSGYDSEKRDLSLQKTIYIQTVWSEHAFAQINL